MCNYGAARHAWLKVAKTPYIVKIMPKRKNDAHKHARPLVVVLAYDQLGLFEFGIAAEIFGLPRPEVGPNWYRFAVAAAEPGELHSLGLIALRVDGGLELLQRADTIIVPSWRGPDAPASSALIDALQLAKRRGARLVSICAGAFVLAQAGLLDGRRATTHWRHAAALAAQFPNISVEPDVLYVDEGDILTSAGSAAGIDLCLHIVRRDFGPTIANQVARRLVMPAHRDGGQAQYIERPVPTPRESSRLGTLLERMTRELARDHTVASLAAETGMSTRTFLRRFQAITGQSPGEWLINVRVARAKEMLESSETPIEEIATCCGFGSSETLRHHFRKRLSLTPTRYRRLFGGH